MEQLANEIKESLLNEIETVKKQAELADLKAKYLGKSGRITELTKNMKDLSVEERKSVGMISNTLKNEVTELLAKKEEEIINAILN